MNLTPLQQLVHEADTKVEEVGGNHHYRKISHEKALARIQALDRQIDYFLSEEDSEV